jgi:F420-0:gamma-glutamyl ligase
MVRRMMLTALEGIPSVMPGDDLAVLVVEACKRSDLALEDGDVVVLAQKIASKSEGRSVERSRWGQTRARICPDRRRRSVSDRQHRR